MVYDKIYFIIFSNSIVDLTEGCIELIKCIDLSYWRSPRIKQTIILSTSLLGKCGVWLYELVPSVLN